jgi:hypothetical protein
MRQSTWILAVPLALATAGGAAWAADGLSAEGSSGWMQWKGRMALGTTAPDWRADLAGSESAGLKLGGVSVMGDYYFLNKALPGTAGGFRATSGLVYGARPTLWAGTPGATSARGVGLDRQTVAPEGTDPATLPYLGFGYTGLSARGGWSFSADVGLLAQNPGSAVRFGRVFNGTQNFDEVMRELRLAPVVQLGVSYAF